MRFIRYFFVFFIAATAWTAAPIGALAQARADEFKPRHADGQSSLPLSHYCTHVPDLSVNRPDSVDTWVKICTVFFNAKIAPPGPPMGGQGSEKQPPPPAAKQSPPLR